MVLYVLGGVGADVVLVETTHAFERGLEQLLVALLSQAVAVVGEDFEQTPDPAIDRERAVHIGLARLEFGVQEKCAVKRLVMETHGR